MHPLQHAVDLNGASWMNATPHEHQQLIKKTQIELVKRLLHQRISLAWSCSGLKSACRPERLGVSYQLTTCRASM
jgi:hypothetical protein